MKFGASLLYIIPSDTYITILRAAILVDRLASQHRALRERRLGILQGEIDAGMEQPGARVILKQLHERVL